MWAHGLIARYPEAGREIVRQVQRRRLLMAGLLLPLLALYSASVKVPLPLKFFLFAFAAAGVVVCCVAGLGGLG